MLLRLDDAPSDPIERVVWLSGVKEQVNKELDAAFEDAYFEARMQQRLDAAITAGPHAKKRVLAYTRRANEKRGRTVRWGDGADPTSTAYEG
jgi:ribosomal protein L15E